MAENAQVLLTEGERRRMLREIATVALTIGRDLYPENDLTDLDIGVSPDSTADVCPRERLAFIASVWPRLASALERIEAEPPPALQQGTRLVPLERARRIAPKDLLAALRRAPVRVAERIALPHYDTPANRLVKTVLANFARDLGVIFDLATVSALPEIAGEAFRLRRAIRSALRRSPWQTLPLSSSTANVSAWAGLRSHGPYRLFWDAGRRYRQGFAFDWSNPLFTLPARETWLLYEYWCLFQVADALRGLGFRTVGSDSFALSRSGLTFRLAWGRASRLTFASPKNRRIHLYYTREFVPPRETPSPNTLYAATHALRPDITLETDDGRLLVLDAKYKGYAGQASGIGDRASGEEGREPENLPLTNDINQLHAYRDGIRGGYRVSGIGHQEGQMGKMKSASSDARSPMPDTWPPNPESRTPVRAGWLLYVGRLAGGNSPIISYPRSTPDAPFGRGEVGALLLRPGVASSLPPLLSAFLANDLG